VQSGTPAELFDKPEIHSSAIFIGSPGMNIVPAEAGREARIGGTRSRSNRGYDHLRQARTSRSACARNSDRAPPAPDLLTANIERMITSPRPLRAGANRRRQICRRVPPGFSIPDAQAGLKFRSVAASRLCRQPSRRGGCLMDKTINQKAWFRVCRCF